MERQTRKLLLVGVLLLVVFGTVLLVSVLLPPPFEQQVRDLLPVSAPIWVGLGYLLDRLVEKYEGRLPV